MRAKSGWKAAARHHLHGDEPKAAERRLVVWSFDDVVFEPGAALGE